MRSSTHKRLSMRDRQILEHVGRYRLTTNGILHRLLFDGQPNAVTKVTTRLTRHGYLCRHRFYHPRVYFTLGQRGVTLLGLPENRTLPLGPQSLPVEYGVLAYATLGTRPVLRLTRTELESTLPGIEPSLAEQAYCRVDSDHHEIELVRVDLGGAPDHVARKAQSDIQSRTESQTFRPMIRAGHFRLVVVTATAEKAAGIREALDRHRWPQGLSIHIAVVPDLLLLTVRTRS